MISLSVLTVSIIFLKFSVKYIISEKNTVSSIFFLIPTGTAPVAFIS